MEGVTMTKDLPIWLKHKKFHRFLWKDTLWDFVKFTRCTVDLNCNTMTAEHINNART
jgi:hypothetical protein